MSKKNKVSRMIAASFSVDEGLDLINHVLTNLRGEEKWFINGFRVKRDFARFAVLASCALSCFKCGRKATHFLVDKHKNDRVMPYSLNVYSGNIMMTWDHILPKSWEGGDAVINGRCACSTCNENRGNEMTLQEMVWAATQGPDIYKQIQFTKASASEVVGLVRKEFNRISECFQNEIVTSG